MKTRQWLATLCSLTTAAWGLSAAHASPFEISCATMNADNIANGTANESGYTLPSVLPGMNASTGVYQVSSGTTNISPPPNGVLCVKTWNGASSSGTLTFVPNDTNSPVTILVEDSFNQGNQTLSVDGTASQVYFGLGVTNLGGRRGPGGSDGGSCDFAVQDSWRAGDGLGPGGGRGNISGGGGGGAAPTRDGTAGFGSTDGVGGIAPSGFAKRMLHGGSGGGCGNLTAASDSGQGGGGGGGVLTIAAGEQINVSSPSFPMSARGGSGQTYGGGGGGGVVRLVAPVITGAGSIDVRGGKAESCSNSSQRGGCGGNGLIKLEGVDVGGNFVSNSISLNGKDSIRYGAPTAPLLATGSIPRAVVLSVAADFDGTVQTQTPVAPAGALHAHPQVSTYYRSEQVLTVTVRTWHVPSTATVLVRMNSVDPAPGSGSANLTTTATNPTGSGVQRDWTATLTVPAGAKLGTIEAYVGAVCTPGSPGCAAVQ